MSDHWDEMRERFHRVRVARGLDSLAHEIEVDRTTVYRWARGDMAPRGRNLRAVRQVIDRYLLRTQRTPGE